MRTLTVGQKNHTELSNIIYCGMLSKNVFSIAVSELVNKAPFGRTAISYNLYYPTKVDHIIAGGKFYTVHKVTPEEIMLQEMR